MNADECGARVRIQHIMAVYANSVDGGDVDGVVSAFADDARLQVSSGPQVQGREAIRAFYEPVIGAARPDRVAGEPIPLLRHNLTTSRVEFASDDTAQGWTYFMVVTRHGLDHTGHSIDSFSRHGDRWLIADRRIVVEWFGSPSWYQQVRLKPAAAQR
jgi:hypothetical protein